MTDVIRKAMAQIEPGVDDAESPHGTFRVILSDETFDRDGESLKSGEWITPLPDHITFDIDHAMNVAGTVGSGRPEIGPDGKMYVEGTYASRPLAQEVRSLVNEGHIRTTSVAFLRKKDQKSGATKRELLNGAFVAVPANPNAVILASKAFDPEHDDADTKAGARNSTADAKRLQQMHDLAVENGAACNCDAPDGKSVKRTDAKSIVGSVEALQDRVRDALSDAYPHCYCWLRGVLSDAVIFETSGLGEPDDYESATYRQEYTDDGAVVTLVGEASEVDIHEIVAPDADADREPAAKAASTEDSSEESEDASKAIDEDALYVKAQILALRAAAL